MSLTTVDISFVLRLSVLVHRHFEITASKSDPRKPHVKFTTVSITLL